MPEYQSIIDAENLSNVEFVSNVDFEGLKTYYHVADIFVLPSRRDVWGLVINEAMAYGLPIITTDMCVAGSALVEDGVNGYRVKADDAEGLCVKIKGLLADEILCKKMGISNQKKIKSYTIENMAMGMYNHICNYMDRREE